MLRPARRRGVLVLPDIIVGRTYACFSVIRRVLCDKMARVLRQPSFILHTRLNMPLKSSAVKTKNEGMPAFDSPEQNGDVCNLL
jgi:hypothetical protein